MDLRNLAATMSGRLIPLGYRVVDESLDGPMGSGRVRLTNGRCDVDLHSDRGDLSITLGRHGEQSWGISVWADVLGIVLDERTDVSSEIAFVGAHLRQVEQLLDEDPKLETQLREINWRRVKEYLGLNPNMPPPGRASDD